MKILPLLLFSTLAFAREPVTFDQELCHVIANITFSFAMNRDSGVQKKETILFVNGYEFPQHLEQYRPIIKDIVDIVYDEGWKKPETHKMEFYNFCINRKTFTYYDGRQAVCR